MPSLTFSIPDATMLTVPVHSSRFCMSSSRRAALARATTPSSVSTAAPVTLPSEPTGVIVRAPSSLIRGRPAQRVSESDASTRVSESRRQEHRFAGEQLNQHELLESLERFQALKRLEACLPGAAAASRDMWQLDGALLDAPLSVNHRKKTRSQYMIGSLPTESSVNLEPRGRTVARNGTGEGARANSSSSRVRSSSDSGASNSSYVASIGSSQGGSWLGPVEEVADLLRDDATGDQGVDAGDLMMAELHVRAHGSDEWWHEWARLAGVGSVDELKRRVAEGRKAANKLVMSNMWLARSLARKYAEDGHDLTIEDLTQEGVFGLIRGLHTFDTSKGAKLSTYLYFWVRHAILRAIADQGRLIRVPVYMNSLLQKTRKGRIQLRERMGVEPGVDELAAYLGIKPDKVDELDRLRRMRMLSLNYCGADAEVDQPQELMERLVVQDTRESPEECVDNEFLKTDLEILLDSLKPAELGHVLRLRFGLDDGRGKSVDEVGARLNLARETVRKYERKGLEKLRHPRRAGYLETYMQGAW